MIFGVTHEMLADKMFPGRYRLVLVVNALTFGTRPVQIARVAITSRSRPSGATSIRHVPLVRLRPTTPTVGAARAEPRRRQRPGQSPVAPESDAVVLRHLSNLCLKGTRSLRTCERQTDSSLRRDRAKGASDQKSWYGSHFRLP
jgi:hypothetical protein